MPRIFETDRLVLRPFEDADAPAIAGMLNDAEMCRGLTAVPYPYTLDDAQAFLRSGADDAYAVCLKAGTLIGAMGLGAQLGYWFGRNHWGVGYATEAAKALLAEHFATCDNTVLSGFASWNRASARVLSKLGFEVVGDKMLHIRSLDREVPAKSVALTRAQWEAAQ